MIEISQKALLLTFKFIIAEISHDYTKSLNYNTADNTAIDPLLSEHGFSCLIDFEGMKPVLLIQEEGSFS